MVPLDSLPHRTRNTKSVYEKNESFLLAAGDVEDDWDLSRFDHVRVGDRENSFPASRTSSCTTSLSCDAEGEEQEVK